MDRFDEVKLRVKEATDLVGMIEEYVVLHRRGRYFVALCPFHQEKTPSFTVYPDSQHYKCYGCGVSGDVFSFMMEREGMTFREAFELLADRANISIEGVFGRGRGPEKPKGPDPHAVLRTVAEWFTDVLRSEAGVVARDYLVERGLEAATDGFSLGAYPVVPGALAKLAAQRKLPTSVLEQAGLLGRGGREPFRGRLMFPIVDERDRVVGFGGRVLSHTPPLGGGREPPKYINSPESPFYNKRKVLYGLRQVKNAGVRRVVVVEGYTDVAACHLAGFQGAVATLGTALTADHARLLDRYATDGVVLLFDGDQAGRRAADRAFRELVTTSLPVRIALLPDGFDPADLITVRPGVDEDEAGAGRRHLTEIVDAADDALTMWFRLLRDRLDLSLDANVDRAARECARILTEVESRVRREALGRQMAHHLGVSEDAFRELLRATSRRRVRSRPQPVAEPDMPPPAAAADAAGGAFIEDYGVPDGGGGGDGGHDGGASGEGAALAAPTPARPTLDLRDPAVQADCDLLACLLVRPALAASLDAEQPFLRAEVTPLHAALVALHAAGRDDPDALGSGLLARVTEDDGLRRVVTEALDRARRVRDAEGMFVMCLRNRELFFAKEKMRRLRLEMQEAAAQGDSARLERLTHEFQEHARRARAGELGSAGNP